MMFFTELYSSTINIPKTTNPNKPYLCINAKGNKWILWTDLLPKRAVSVTDLSIKSAPSITPPNPQPKIKEVKSDNQSWITSLASTNLCAIEI